MKTLIIIEVETGKLKPYIAQGEELCYEQEQEFHEQFHKYIESHITDEDFQRKFISEWIHEAEYLNPEAKCFSDIGEISVSISQEKVNK